MLCSKCGIKIDDDSTFGNGYGSKIVEESGVRNRKKNRKKNKIKKLVKIASC